MTNPDEAALIDALEQGCEINLREIARQASRLPDGSKTATRSRPLGRLLGPTSRIGVSSHDRKDPMSRQKSDPSPIAPQVSSSSHVSEVAVDMSPSAPFPSDLPSGLSSNAPPAEETTAEEEALDSASDSVWEESGAPSDASLSATPRIIVLVGLMGAGKTTLGRQLAKFYDLPFVDADAEIERAAGCTVAEIFSRHGEAHFREGEHRVIRRLLRSGPCVLATGGGAWMDERTRRAVRATPGACALWLRVPHDVLVSRVLHKRADRPLLAAANPVETLKRLATAREPFYALADLTIDCGDDSVEQGVQTVQEALAAFAPLQRLPVKLDRHAYDILTGSGLLARASELLTPHLEGKRAIIVTDETVSALHLATLLNGLKPHALSVPFSKDANSARPDLTVDVLTIPPGEGSKSLARYSETMERLLALGIDRGTTIIAFGGGVVGDLAGFMAATALRGVPFIQIPTTLLAQVDSSVGGKTGINAPAGKNLIGAFWQPKLVMADTTVLDTLPRRQLVAGYAEIVKSALIADPDLFAWCERNGASVLDGTPALLAEAVRRACAFKAAVVSADEREQARNGGRALLNLGHTFGHALEAEFGFNGRLLHGEAVSIGMRLALAYSVRLGMAPRADLDRLDAHLAALDMPRALPASLSAKTLVKHMARDKKMRDGRLSFVLLRGIGQAFTCRDVEMEDVQRFLVEEGCAL